VYFVPIEHLEAGPSVQPLGTPTRPERCGGIRSDVPDDRREDWPRTPRPARSDGIGARGCAPAKTTTKSQDFVLVGAGGFKPVGTKCRLVVPDFMVGALTAATAA
jgi:hypothetical protein